MRAEAERDQAIAERRPFALEFRVTLDNGDIRWLTGHGRAFYNEQGEVVRVVGLNQDITERKRAEMALLEERASMKALLENTDGSIWAVDVNYRLIAGNSVFLREARRDLAYDFAIGDYVLARGVSPEAIAAWKARYDRALGGEAFTVETQCFSDETCWQEYRLNPIRSANGEVTGVTVFGREISAQKRAEAQIRDQLAEIAFYYDNAPIGLTVLDTDLRFMRINKLLAETNGIPAADHVGKTVEEIVPELAAQGRAIAAKILATGEPVTEIEISGETAAQPGVMRTWKEGWYPLRRNDQTIVGFSVIAQEVTETRQALEALKQSQRNLARAQEIGHLGSWEWDVVNHSLVWSDEMYRIFGVPHDFPLTYDSIETMIHPDDRADNRTRVQEALYVHDATTYEFRILRPDGLVRHVAQNIVISRDETGAPLKLFGVVQDITERKLAEAEHEQLHEQLAQAQKMELIGRLAGGIAHEFNNLLAVILLRLEMSMALVAPSTNLHYNLRSVYDAGQHAAELVRQLLGFARQQVINPKVLDLNVAVEGLLPRLRTLVGEQIDLRWSPGAALWPVKVDQDQLEQVLVNLCTNARDAIVGSGVITIETRNHEAGIPLADPGAAPLDAIVLTVADTGCGMDEATLGHIFEPFFSTKEVGKGSGLGLPMVQGIVEQNGGRLEVSSQPGHGATFAIYLRRHVAQPASVVPVEPSVLRRGHGETVLVIEEEPVVLHMATEALEYLGYRVFGYRRPSEALRWLVDYQGTLDVVMADLSMSEMSAAEMANRLAVIRTGFRCIWLSGYSDDAFVDRNCLFLQKPYSLQALADTLRRALGDAPSATPSDTPSDTPRSRMPAKLA